MRWDTETSCGSIMNLGPPSIRLDPLNKHASVCRDNVGIIEPYNKEKKRGPYLCISSQELKELGGLQNIKAELPDWPVSDDTILHLATAEGLATGKLRHHPKHAPILLFDSGF